MNIWEAACGNHVETVREILDAGFDINARNAEGRTALHDSIEHGADAVTSLLLDRGAEVDICAAAILGELDRVQELLDADPELANDRTTGLSPLGWASFGNQCGTAALLIDRGARMDDHELICAASVSHVEVGRLLIERGADPNALCGNAGGGPLHAAVAMRYTCDSSEFIKMLLEHGADVGLRTPTGFTARDLAEMGAKRQAGLGDEAKRQTFPRECAKVAAILKAAETRKG